MKNKENIEKFIWEEMTWVEIEKNLRNTDTAILPCGSIEQHGPHLTVDIDYYDAMYLAKKAAERCYSPKPFVLPALPYGVAYHHEAFKGTISVTNHTLTQFVYEIGMNMSRSGIKKLVLLNGHGDNAPALNNAAQMINRDSKIFVCVETGETSDVELYKLIDTPNDIHAGEIETSTSLALRPDMVKMDKAVNETLDFGSKFLNFDSAHSVDWYVRTNKISRSGVIGDATKASAEKGAKVWEIMIGQMVRFLEFIKTTPLDDLYQKRY